MRYLHIVVSGVFGYYVADLAKTNVGLMLLLIALFLIYPYSFNLADRE